ncbi:GNAT family N-acetyltransferase [Microvirga makkahensis]|uniref:GNAT family N-acetyltransferase n=1 Tax=Microvirga makkahensis TaxID=1128670 RepID=UPI00197B85F4
MLSEDRHLALISQGFALVVETPGRGIIAFLNGEQTTDCLHRWQIAVHRDFQRHGIGCRLVEEALRIAAHHGISNLTLTTLRDVPWNEPYYQRLRFKTLQETSLTPQGSGG